MFDDSVDTFSSYTIEFIAKTLTFAPQFIGQNDMILALDGLNNQITYITINQVDHLEYNHRLAQTSLSFSISSSYSLDNSNTSWWDGLSYINQFSIETTAENVSPTLFNNTSSTSEL